MDQQAWALPSRVLSTAVVSLTQSNNILGKKSKVPRGVVQKTDASKGFTEIRVVGKDVQSAIEPELRPS